MITNVLKKVHPNVPTDKSFFLVTCRADKVSFKGIFLVSSDRRVKGKKTQDRGIAKNHF